MHSSQSIQRLVWTEKPRTVDTDHRAILNERIQTRKKASQLHDFSSIYHRREVLDCKKRGTCWSESKDETNEREGGKLGERARGCSSAQMQNDLVELVAGKVRHLLV